jgi:hypothetical protein
MLVVLRFKKASEVVNFQLSFMKNVSTPTEMSMNYNAHFLLLQDYFHAVANWL